MLNRLQLSAVWFSYSSLHSIKIDQVRLLVFSSKVELGARKAF